MSNSIAAIFGVLEPRVIHQATDEEIQMIKSLVKDISSLRNQSKASALFGWATAFLGAAFSAFLTLVALSQNSQYYYLICWLIFLTGCLGLYFLWNWRVNQKQEVSAVQKKEQEFDELLTKIEKRIPKDSQFPSEYEQIIVEEQLGLRQL